MSNGFERLMTRIEHFENTHTKVTLPERKALIQRQYERLMFELKDEADFSYLEEKTAVNLTITADSFLTCDDGGHSLNTLIGMANYSEIDIIDNHIVIHLWFRLWEWVDKEK